MKVGGYLYCGLTNTLNIVIYAAIFGHHIRLEGRVPGGVFSNWLRRFRAG
jgi:hypothetical protein